MHKCEIVLNSNNILYYNYDLNQQLDKLVDKTVERLFEIIAKIKLIKGLFSPLLVLIWLNFQVNPSLRPTSKLQQNILLENCCKLHNLNKTTGLCKKHVLRKLTWFLVLNNRKTKIKSKVQHMLKNVIRGLCSSCNFSFYHNLRNMESWIENY